MLRYLAKCFREKANSVDLLDGIFRCCLPPNEKVSVYGTNNTCCIWIYWIAIKVQHPSMHCKYNSVDYGRYFSVRLYNRPHICFYQLFQHWNYYLCEIFQMTNVQLSIQLILLSAKKKFWIAIYSFEKCF